MDKVPYLGHTLLRWQCGPSTFLALPEKGARLMNWNIELGDGSFRDIIHWPELRALGDIAQVRGGNPVLFPFCGRCVDEGLPDFWRGADGLRRPMPEHGFARHSEFRLTRVDGRGFGALLVPDEAARAAYPFDYEFEVTYRFEPFGLACEYTLRNLGKVPLPWSAGHLFHFRLPWEEGTSRADYLIRIPATTTLHPERARPGELIPGPALPLNQPLSNPDLVDTQHVELRGNTIVFGLKGRPGDIHVRIGTGHVPAPDMTLVTTSNGVDEPCYCVAPWMGPSNAPARKQGLHWVAPGHTQNFLVEVAVK